MNFFAHIAPQLDELSNDLFNKGYTPEEIAKPLRSELYWWQNPIFKGSKVNFDSAEMDFVGWLSAAEILTDDFNTFNSRLIYSISASVEHQWEIRQRELQEDLVHELHVHTGHYRLLHKKGA